ncbi:MAG: O-linked N-acetylglucosamine transferase, SPINDLY family protein [Microcystis viridis Mv_BB_P_19951000_S69]|uniref:O-linked N-acetylglucosamine transferase, SPINDLY family protein n=1 Tax=Microcystis viridis Mv_BB_P_19951000_S68D TaxID=2486270 RepID=A0A552HYU7_MICVR|nr:MAG: O-linked N-acetylglucosamine transferase, SPINDLY family protein [Microcystis viridis Mv_BB_P_19951000_S69]TRU76390.1 MAG: O-linked N-acetylglucosamine transferase, SPINDLY family protein [Microcystis viridis Mv_BB_P_19951000_S68D]TRU78563.1 MAG: O-linked N-acetylglucosamine transferase, SPINDLY family protein [Microcystis viridis Mv_BB_P_19951000_S68]TRU89369.1 MAG: O-linked N-acetylglucosamine transferase, SPINDLY family protein [Microcystis viridis Mv_BB_P_19951000_S69D]
MSWQNEVKTALENNQYDIVSQFYEELIERDPLEISYYWYLGLSYLLQGREEEAQTIWLFVLSQGDEEEVMGWTADLVNILDGEARRQVTLKNWQLSWVIRQHIYQINPDNLENLLYLVLLEIKLEYFYPQKLKDWQIVDLINSDKLETFDTNLLLHTIYKLLDWPAQEVLDIIITLLKIESQQSAILEIIEQHIEKIYYSDKTNAFILTLSCLDIIPDRLPLLYKIHQYYFDTGNFELAMKTVNKIRNLASDKGSKLDSVYLLLYTELLAGNWLNIDNQIQEYYQAIQNNLEQHQCPIRNQAEVISITSPLAYLKDDLVGNRWLTNQLAKLFQEAVRKRFNQVTIDSQRPKDVNKKLNIGYIANTLRRHSVGFLSRWLIHYHQRDDFNIHLYLVNQVEDDITEQWFKNKVYKYDNLPANPQIIAEKINQDNIDILVDLDSITHDTTCRVMALKPAPIQVTWLGLDAAGIPAIDYFIVDDLVLEKNAQEFYQEKLWRLPNCYLSVDGFEIGTPTLTRQDLNIPAEAITYLTLQVGLKRNPATIRLQMQIIKAVPKSYLLIKGAGSEKLIKDLFISIAKEEGIDENRLRFLSGVAKEEIHRANLQIADVVLDTYPYSGATTTLETLWMGIPVVTKVGQQWASRNSYTFMTYAGISEGIAWSDEEYIQWGIKLGMDEELRKKIALQLQASRQTAPLWNARQFTKDVENAYRQMWQIYCES